MNLRCRIFGHTFVDSFKYRTCLRCGVKIKRVLTGLHREVDENAKIILILEAEFLLHTAETEHNH